MTSYRSARFGRFEIEDGAALRFPDGVAGLSHLEWFAILKRRADSVFLWLQSLDDADVALPIVLPWAFHWDYEIELPDADLRSLGVSSAGQGTGGGGAEADSRGGAVQVARRLRSAARLAPFAGARGGAARRRTCCADRC